MSVVVHAPRPRQGVRPSRILNWEGSSKSPLDHLAEQLSSASINIKPKELHLAFDCGNLRSTKFSRFKPLKISPSRPRYGGGRQASAFARSDTVLSMRTRARTVVTDVAILVTRLVRRESTYIVWGAIMAPDSPAVNAPPRNVFVKIAVDEEGGEDLREDARLHQQLVERGVSVGYYGIFTDSIGSTAIVIEDYDDEPEVISPVPSP